MSADTCISIIVPCRNEVDHVDPFLRSVFAQRLPPGTVLEVLVADGASDDGTRARLAAWAERDPRLVVLDNPARIVSAALNNALERARGEVIVRMDVHTLYADDYVAECARVLAESGATCVGGAWRARGSSGRQLAIARAFASGFGSGGAASRRLDYSGPADTVYLGAWRRDELLRLGGFDESLVRNQDDELNLRIVRGGGRIWQSASIRSWYTPRGSFAALLRQFWQYGYWKVAVIRKHLVPAAPRHLVPIGFLVLLAGLAAGGFAWSPAWGLLVLLLASYGTVALTAAASIARPWREPRQWLGIAAAYGCMHLGYGLGFARGLWDAVRRPREPGAAATRLTR